MISFFHTYADDKILWQLRKPTKKYKNPLKYDQTEIITFPKPGQKTRCIMVKMNISKFSYKTFMNFNRLIIFLQISQQTSANEAT